MTVSVDKSLMARHFSLHAGDYDGVTPVQAEMGRHLLELAKPELGNRQPELVLELGCGTGRLTAELRRAFAEAQIVAVDMSAAMLDIARQRLSGDSVSWLVADAERLAARQPAGQRYDLIISNAMVQWLDHPLTAIERYRRLLTPGGVLAVSTFGAETFSELRQAFAEAERQLNRPVKPHALELLDPAAFRELPGAAVAEQRVQQWFADVRDFLRSIKLTGATMASPNNSPVDRALYQRFIEVYEHDFRDRQTGKVSATYHCLYLICQAPR